MRKQFLFVLLTLSSLLLCSPTVAHAQWEPDVRLTYSDSSSWTCANNSNFIAACGDTVYIVWTERRDAGHNKIYLKRSTNGGSTWESDNPITGDSATPLPPCIAVEGSFIHVVWQDWRDGPLKRIYYKRSTNGGTTWEPDRRIENDTTSSEYPSVAAAGPYVHVVWHDVKRDTLRFRPDLRYCHSTNGGASWDTVIRLTEDRASSLFPSIATFQGSVHITWLDDGRVLYKRSTDQGASWSPDTALASKGTNTRPLSIAASDSNIHIIWDKNARLCYLRSTNNGSQWKPETLLTNYSSLTPSITASGPNVHLAWHGHPNGPCAICYKHSTDWGTSWCSDESLSASPAPGNPSIVVSGLKVHLAWNDYRHGNNEMYYKRNLTGNSGTVTAEERGQRLEVRLKATPNPFTTFAIVPGQEKETFELYDIAGRKVGTYRGDRIGEGQAAGVYFLRLQDYLNPPMRVVKVR